MFLWWKKKPEQGALKWVWPGWASITWFVTFFRGEFSLSGNSFFFESKDPRTVSGMGQPQVGQRDMQWMGVGQTRARLWNGSGTVQHVVVFVILAFVVFSQVCCFVSCSVLALCRSR